MKNTLILFLVASFIMLSCKTETKQEVSDNQQDTKTETSAEPKIKLYPKTPGESFPDANMSTWDFKNGQFSFGIKSKTYTLGSQTPDAEGLMCANSAKGQHIHLIVDNKPYAAKYESKFDYEIEDGQHYILAFLSRSYHESIKTDAAHKAVIASVEKNSFTKVTDIKDPMLFYSRPKGTYVGKDAKKLLLDFYPVNADLGTDYKVKVETNGETFMIDKWTPHILEGLPFGENTVTLTLVDGDGKIVKAPYNPVSRTFTLKEDPIK